MRVGKIILATLFFGLIKGLQGQALKGGDIHIRYITGNLYAIEARLAVNWPNSLNKPYLKVDWGDGSPLDSLSFGSSNCTLYGATTLIYNKNHNYLPNNTYTVSITDDFYVPGIANIPNSSSKRLSFRTQFNTNSSTGSNTTADFPVMCLTDSVPCCGESSYNPGAVDVDGDSLSYMLVSPLNIPGYARPSVTLNQVTGTLTFTSNPGGLVAVSTRIDEWRKISGVPYKIASTYQELFFKVYGTVGIQQWERNNTITVYPNPASSVLHIKDLNINDKDTRIEVVNNLGQPVISMPFQQEIDISQLTGGYYIIRVFLNQEVMIYSKFAKL